MRRVRHAELGPEARAYGLERVRKAYPGWKPADVRSLLIETTESNLWHYEPYTVFRPRPYRGRWINFSPAGFRFGATPDPWPPDPRAFNVLRFGGSTAFGVGVPDRGTIAASLAHLRDAPCGKPVHVYNFGRPGYISVQEGIRFQRLLRSGARPDLVIFFDGLNEFATRIGDGAVHLRTFLTVP